MLAWEIFALVAILYLGGRRLLRALRRESERPEDYDGGSGSGQGDV